MLALAGAAIAVAPALAQRDPAPGSDGVAYSIQLQATIDPATEKWIGSALDDAAGQDAKLAIIRLDTPGGLTDSMRSIVQEIAAAPMPVVVYVSPNGARAGSAGAFITEAADVAAMAPETNIGSATPIAIGPSGGSQDLSRKINNDAAASMRALAAAHGRNAHLAELLVTQASNLTAGEAKRDGLIDVIAPSQERLLTKLDGFHVQGPNAGVLHTAGLEMENHDLPFTYELLEIIVNPTISYLLILVGLLGMGIEIFSPGLIAPGTIGLISLLLGLYGTAQLPVTVAGVLLLVAGIAMIIAEAHLPTHGILGASGVAALIASGLLLYDTELQRLRDLDAGGDHRGNPAGRAAGDRGRPCRSRPSSSQANRLGGDGRMRRGWFANGSIPWDRRSSRGRCGAPSSSMPARGGPWSAAVECGWSR